MFAALRLPDFRLLLIGGLVSNLGSWLLMFALPYRVFELTGSATATGLTVVAEALPSLLVGPVAGVFVDRWDLRRVMIATDLLRAVVLVGLLFADRPGRVGWVYLALLAENMGTVFSQPAARALLPGLVGTGPELAGANSLLAVNSGLVNLAGPPVGALLLVWLGLPALVLIDMASYLVSAVAIAGLRRRPRSSPPAARRLSSLPAELRAGLRWVLGSRTLRWLLPVTFTFFAANAVFTALLVPFLAVRFGGQPGALGAVLSALGAGFLVGGPLAGPLVRGRPPRVPLTIGLAGVGGCYAVLANAPTLLVAIAATGFVGLGGSLLLVTVATTIQRGTPAPLLGRVSATFYASDAAATVAGALAGAAAGHPAVLPVVLTWSAGAILLCAVVAPVAVRGHYSVRATTFSNAAGQRTALESAEKTSPPPGI